MLPPGGRLVLYTDGIVEASPPEGREPYFGTDRLIEAARDQRGTAESACIGIFAHVDEFTRGAALRDDATLVVVLRS